jgi:hypothetical protein
MVGPKGEGNRGYPIPEDEKNRKESRGKLLEKLGLPVDLESRPIEEQLDIVTKRLNEAADVARHLIYEKARVDNIIRERELERFRKI